MATLRVEATEGKRVIRAVILAAVAAVATAGAARGEMPQSRAAPEVTGRAAVGWGLVGHNGTWLYDDGTACGPECSYVFAWERCRDGVCRPLPGATARVHKVRAVDIGFRFRVVVTTTKYDCGEWNHAAGTQECRFVSRLATSAQTAVIPKPRRPASAKKPVRPRPRR